MEISEISTRFLLTIAMLLSILMLVAVVMIMAAYGKPVPDFVSGVILGAMIGMLKDAYTSYFKAREEEQVARIASIKPGD